MVLKRLKLHQLFNGWHELFPTHKHGCRKWDRNLKNSAKKLFSYLWVVNPNFTTFAPPKKQLLKKSTSAPRIKSFRRPCTQAYKLHHFCKNCAVLHHVTTLFNNTNAVSIKQAITGWRTITKSCQIHCQVTNNILKIALLKFCNIFHIEQFTLALDLILILFRQNSKFKSGGPRPMRPPLFRHLCLYRA